ASSVLNLKRQRSPRPRLDASARLVISPPLLSSLLRTTRHGLPASKSSRAAASANPGSLGVFLGQERTLVTMESFDNAIDTAATIPRIPFGCWPYSLYGIRSS